MKAVIMAGGEGTRLRPLTCDIPKPMVSLLGKPVLEYTVELLKKYGIHHMAFTLMYLPQKIMNYFGEGENHQVHIDYYLETSPLGTAGSVKNAAENLQEPFLVMSGDALTDLNLESFMAFHRQKKAKVTMALKSVKTPRDYGVVIMGTEGYVEKFVEKPSWSEVFSDLVNTGIYIVEPEVLNGIPDDRPFDFAKDLFPLLMEQENQIAGYIMEDYWCDIGSIDTYLKAHEDILNGTCKAVIPGKNIGGIYVQEGAQISSSAVLQPPIFIGKNAMLDDGASIGMYSSIGNGAYVGKNANVKRSIVLEGAHVGQSSKASRAVVCAQTVLEKGVRLFEQSIVGQKCILEKNATVGPKVKIWPDKWIERESYVGQNIVFGKGKKSRLFEHSQMVMNLNEYYSVEDLAKMGSCIAKLVGSDKLLIGYDESAQSSAVAGLIANGAILGGCKTFLMKNTFAPILAVSIANFNMAIGVFVQKCGDMNFQITLYGRDGKYLSAQECKALGSYYAGISGEKKPLPQVDEAREIDNYFDFYLYSLKEEVDVDSLKKDVPKVKLGKATAKAEEYLKNALSFVGIQIAASEKDRPSCRVENYDDLINGRFILAGHTIDQTNREYFITLLLMNLEKTESLYIPHGYPRQILNYGKAKNKIPIEVSRKELESAESLMQHRLKSDFAYMVIYVLGLYVKNRQLVLECLEWLESIQMKTEQISCGYRDFGKVLKGLSQWQDAQKCQEGVEFMGQDGYVYICPNNTEPKIDIKIESMNEEFSREIFDFYKNKIMDLLKD